MATYYLTGTNSDLSGGVVFSKSLKKTTGSAGSITVPVSNSATEESYGYTDAGVPNNAAWGSGLSFTIKVNVTTASSSIFLKVRVSRVNSAGTVQQSSSYTAEQALSSTGVKTFSLSSVSFSGGSATDRIRVDYSFRSTNSHGGSASVVIDDGTTNESVVSGITEVPLTPVVANLEQYDSDRITPLAVGGNSTTGSASGINLEMDMRPNADTMNDLLYPKVEVEALGTSFDDAATATGAETYFDPDEPKGFRGSAFAYDSTRKRFIMTFGANGSTSQNSVYELRSLNGKWKWRQLATTGSTPTARYQGGGVYDAVNDRFIAVFGFTSNDTNELWAINFSSSEEGAWQQLTSYSGTAPSIRSNVSQTAVNDPTNQCFYVFGGWGASYYNGLYKFSYATSNGTWSTLSADGAGGNAPSARRNASMVLDTANNRLIVFGGNAAGTTPQNDVKAFNLGSSTWSALSPTGTAPSARERHWAAYDPVNHRMFIGGGDPNDTTAVFTDYWVLNTTSGSEAWTRADPTDEDTQPLGTYLAVAKYNPDEELIVIWNGGVDITGDLQHHVNLFDVNETSNITMYGAPMNHFMRPMDAPAITWDSDANEAVVIGGYSQIYDYGDVTTGGHVDDTFAYNYSSNSWRVATAGNVTFPHREGMMCAYDTTGDRIIAFGGLWGNGGVSHGGGNAVWEIKRDSNGNYQTRKMFPSGTKPGGRWLGAIAYDSANNRIVVTCGSDGGGGNFNDVWSLSLASGDGTWSQLSPTGTAPTGMWQSGYCYDDTNHKLYIFGGATSSGDSGYTTQAKVLSLSTTNGAWSALTAAPSGRRGWSCAVDVTNQKILLFGGYDGSSVYDTAYIYDIAGNSYSSAIQPGTRPGARRSAAAWYDTTQSKFLITHGRPTSGTWFGDTWQFTPNYTTPTSSTWTDRTPAHYIRGSVNVTGLANNTSYHWQGWVTDDGQGADSTKTSYGGNAETAADFILGSAVSTFTKTHTTNALKRANLTRSHTTSSVMRKQFTLTHTTSSYLKKQLTKTHTTSANKKKTSTATHTTNANKRVSGVTRSHTTNALKRQAFTLSHTTNALRRSGLSLAHTTDSYTHRIIIGNDTVEASTGTLSNNILGTGFAAPQDGYIRSITAYLNPTGTTRVATYAVYDTSDNLIAQTEEIVLGSGSGWYTANFSAPVQVTNGVTYRLVAWADGSFAVTIARASQTGVGRFQALTYTGTYPDPASTTTNNFRYSIYATYEQGVGRVSHTTDAYTKNRFTASHTTDSYLTPSVQTFTTTHTTDTLKRKQATLTHTTSANKRAATTRTHTTSSNKRKQTTVFHTTNANKKVSNLTLSHTTNALKRQLFTKSHTTDAFRHRQLTLSHTTDAFKHITTTLAHTTDSFLHKQLTLSHTTNSLKRVATVLTHSTNALKRAALTVSHTTSANKKLANITKSHTTDSFLRKQQTVAHTTSANKRLATTKTHTTDALKRVTGLVRTHTTDSFLRKAFTKSHSTDANLKKSGLTLSHSTSAFLRSAFTLSHTTSSNKRKAITTSHTTSANKRVSGVTVSHTTDSNIKRAYSVSHSTDTNKKKAAITVAHSTDSFLRRMLALTHTTNAFKRTQNTLTHTTDSLLRTLNTLVHTTNSFLRSAATLTHATDANKKRGYSTSHTTDSNKKVSGDTVNHSTDSLLRQIFELAHSTDTLKRLRSVLTHTTDSALRTQNTVQHTTDSNRRKVTLATHTTDSNKRKLFTVTHTTSANKRVADNLLQHTTDALLRTLNPLTHTTDSMLRVRSILTHSTDTLTRSQDILTHTTDSNKRKVTTLQHSTDTLKRSITEVSHTTDSLLRQEIEVAHDTDANKRGVLEASHDTDSFIRAGNQVVHNTDANKKKPGITRTHTTSANKKLANNILSHTTDTLKRVRSLVTHLTDSNKRRATTIDHTTDGLLRTSNVLSHVTDTLKRTANIVSHATDSLVRGAYVVTHSTDANKRRETTVDHTTDSNQRKAAVIAHTADSNKRRAYELAHSTDSNKKTAGNKISHSTDGLLRRVATVLHTTDTLKRVSPTLTHSTDGFLRTANQVVHLTDSNKRKVTDVFHTTNAFLRGADSVTHSTSANKRLGTVVSHTTSANKRSFGTLLHTTDTLIRTTGNIFAHTTDAALRKAYVVEHTADALLRKALSTSHTTSAFLRAGSQVTHSTSSALRKAYGVTHTTNANKRKTFSVDHSTDTYLRLRQSVAHTTDSFLRKARTVAHSTSSVLRRASLVAHTTSAVKRAVNASQHTTDSLLKQRHTTEHSTDAFLREQHAVQHNTSANKKRGQSAQHTTDSNAFTANQSSHTTDSILLNPRGKKKVLIDGVWQIKPVKILVGSTWESKPVKYFNGTDWVTTTY